ncbi:DUF6114 domain-containing protein [Streptomyces sp. NPDC005438]|uniref:DUF6114 domain-containing protein n=1 Tax=Streptomyces sp. NPDC005438 TaxID=3156880 RepID=UPI0033A0FDD4
MSADTSSRLMTQFGQKRLSFREWRWQRPFWGGLLTLLGGIPIMYIPYANLTLGSLTIRMSTTAGAGSLIIGVLLVVLGLTMWFQPHSRVFAGVAAILLALVSLVVSNVGGFLVGFLLALVGGALGVSWAPGESPSTDARRTRTATRTEKKADPEPEDAVAKSSATRSEAASDTGDDGSSDVDSASDDEAHANGRHRAG